MLYITGDTHGDWKSRLNPSAFPEQSEMSKDDYVLICGDFGFWHDTEEERKNLKWLENRPFTTLWVDGNHENFDRLYELPVKLWHGGKIHKINNSVYHLIRGLVFDIEGKIFFTFGGASSHDIQDGVLEENDFRVEKWKRDCMKMFRINHVSWWEQELPSEEEMLEGLANLEENDNKVDYIITHSPYTSLLKQMDGGAGLYESDILTDYLQKIKQTVEYKQWIFGHMHVNQMFHWERSV